MCFSGATEVKVNEQTRTGSFQSVSSVCSSSSNMADTWQSAMDHAVAVARKAGEVREAASPEGEMLSLDVLKMSADVDMNSGLRMRVTT